MAVCTGGVGTIGKGDGVSLSGTVMDRLGAADVMGLSSDRIFELHDDVSCTFLHFTWD